MLEKTIYKRILLAVCGGIAAYKAAELVRLLGKQGVQVRVVMTDSARKFVTPLTFQALSGHPVQCDLLDADEENAMGHINLARWADLLLVAPASANTIAKFSHGLADNLLSTLYLAANCPVAIAPAMNQAMWLKPVVQENIRRLRQQGVTILGPAQGEQACGETGPGRMLQPEQICQQIWSENEPSLLSGKSVLITAGPTREPLDSVRYISNRSSGKMGYALAQAANRQGADVTLVSGPVVLESPAAVDLVLVETAAQMYDAVLERAAHCDIYIGAAAVADYSPMDVKQEKIKKHDTQARLVLHKTRDILSAVAAQKKPPLSVGFAAETHDLETHARGKLQDKNLDMIAANWVGRDRGGFDSEQNALQVFWSKGQQDIAMADKQVVAEQLIQLIVERYNEERTT